MRGSSTRADRHRNVELKSTFEESILFVEVGAEPEFTAIVDKLRRLIPHHTLLGVGQKSPLWISPYDEVVVEEKDLVVGSTGVALRNGTYIDPDLYLSVTPHYATILRMAERLNDGYSIHIPGGRRRFCTAKYSDRHRFFLELCAFWDQVIAARNIRAVIFNSLPHMFWDALLFTVAKARGIPCLYFHNVRPFSRCIYIHEDPMKMGELDFGKELLEATRLRHGLIENTEQRRIEMRLQVSDQSVENQILVASKVIPGVLTRLSGATKSPKSLLRRLGYSAVRRVRHSTYNRSRKSFHSEGALPDKYFFLELQPENNATTHVKGFMYGDQYEMLAHICDSLPEGFSLVVKENVRQIERKQRRRPYFWSDVACIPNIHLCQDDVDLKDILRGSNGVIELGYSSLALKALKSGLPVVILGLSHLQNLLGTITVHSDGNLNEALVIAAQRSQRKSVSDIATSESLETWIESTLAGTVSGDLTWFPVKTSQDRELLSELNSNIAATIETWYVRSTRSSEN